MDSMKITENLEALNVLKKDSQRAQKRGLPFMMASVVIWGMILGTQLLDKTVSAKNFYAFACSAMLMPLAFAFSRLIRADIFRKSKNPIDQLGFLCTMNQMLYLVIVMWAFSQKPEAMVMLYAMVFGAHLLPFGWVYDSKAYYVFAVADCIGAMAIRLAFGNVAMVGFIICMQIALCVLLFQEIRRE